MKNMIGIGILLFIILAVGGMIYWQNKGVPTNNQPSVTLISPNGGEVLKEGSVYTIKWSTQNIPAANKISINIRRVAPPSLPSEGQEFDPIIFINLENTGSVDWNISDMYPEGNYILGITSYTSIPITDAITDESDNTFNIIK